MRLLIYIEPTSYIIALLNNIKMCTCAPIKTVFLEENLTQNWGIDLKSNSEIQVLRGGFFSKLVHILQLISHRDIEVVHLAGWGHPLLLVAMVSASLRRISVTVETDTPLPIGLSSWKRVVKKMLYPQLFKLPSMFLPGGTRQAKYLQYYGVPRSRISIAQMTVDVVSISKYIDAIDSTRRVDIRKSLGLSENAVIFLYVGRMEVYKGVLELIDAFTHQSADSVLLLVGDGSLFESITQKSITDLRIKVTGRLSGSELLDMYAISDIFVLASSFESWGLVVNEAMSAGLPVIATDKVGCVDDLVVDGETGLVVSSESRQTLSVAMRNLLDDISLRNTMSCNARNLIKGWSLENEAEIIVSAWEKVSS